MKLPALLMTSEAGSYARFTVTDRMPQIIEQVLSDNEYPATVVRALVELREEIASRPMRPLVEDAPDAPFWHQELASYSGKTWLEVGWYFAETYFYRRLLEAVHYFQPGPWQGRDPFWRQKRGQEAIAVERMGAALRELADAEPAVVFEALLHSCLWGNRADLSNISVQAQAHGGLLALEERHKVLIDQTDEVRDLLSREVARVDFVNDNVGLDLLFDLALADFLLLQAWTGQVTFHLKDRPFFVSDAMVGDVQVMLLLLRTARDEAVQDFARRLDGHLQAGRLILTDDAVGAWPFWTSCLMFRRLPRRLREDLTRADLVILKGDVNYRRLLDDRHWPHTTRLEDAAGYFPASFLVLRTLKGEIMVGLEPGRAEELSAEDPDWLTNGERGIVQLVSSR